MRAAPASLLLTATLTLGCAPSVRPSPERAPDGPASASQGPSPSRCERPALIVQLTVDQLRGDLLARYLEHFGERGFRRFVDEGVWYLAAHHDHAITETAPGHASLATGASPRAHGIVANEWLDPESGALVYNTADAQSPLLGVEAPAENGRSPRRLAAPTVADQIVSASAGRARAFAVSIKDRGAVLMAGRLGKPFWYDKGTGRFITSRFYAKALPEWLARFNASAPWRPYDGATWTPRDARDDYLFGDRDDGLHEGGVAGWGATFPHAYGSADAPGFFAKLAFSPAGDALTLALVRALFEAEQPGSRAGVTDYLSISFSSTDYVGHVWGPSSLESEDNLRRLDGLLAELLALLDAEVGLDRTLVVLSADHGVGEIPEQRAAQGFAAANLGAQDVGFSAVDAFVEERTGAAERLFGVVRAPYVWLDAEAVERAGLTGEQAQALLAEAFVQLPGVRAAFTRAQLEDDGATDDALLARARASYFPGRSGDLHLVPEPHTLLSLYPDAQPLAASHGTPWAYDTHVPILALGAGLPSARVARPVAPRAIAPSLAVRAGVGLPAAAGAALLDEVVQCR